MRAYITVAYKVYVELKERVDAAKATSQPRPLFVAGSQADSSAESSTPKMDERTSNGRTQTYALKEDLIPNQTP